MTGKPELAKTGNGILSQTNNVVCYTGMKWNIDGCENTFNLIDTPGLEDTSLDNRGGKRDNETLLMLNQVLTKYKGKIHLVIPVLGKEALTPSFVE